MFGTKDKTRNLVNAVCDGDYFVMAAGSGAPAKKELLSFAKEFSVKFPKDYIAHSTGEMVGLYVEVKEDIWPKPKVLDVGPFWTFCYGIYTYAFSDSAPEWMQIRKAAEEFRKMGHSVVPVLCVCSDADVYCFDSSGKLVQYRHEEDLFEPVTMTFFELLERELNELADRKCQKKEGV